MKHKILFVDDDVNLLRGLQRLLRSQREQWEMTFVEGPRQALEVLASTDFDVIVSDMRMPELDGAALLSQVETQHPGTVRVILSGYAEEKSVFRSVGPAHQYLAKPCPPEAIIAIMERTLLLRSVLAQPQLRNMAARLRNLPSPPGLYLRLTSEMQKEEASTNRVAEMVSEDLAMTAELLKITNSSYFSLSAKVTSVKQSVRLLGLETVRTLVLTSGIFKQFEGKPGRAAMLQALSAYALSVGSLAQRLAKQDGADDAMQAQVYCAAMLSSVGSLILLDAQPERYEATLKTPGPNGWEASERAAFGASHAELGAYLLGLWGFPDAVVEAVLFQLQPSDCPHRQKSILTFVHLARVFGPSFPFGDCMPALDKTYVEMIGLAGNLSDLKSQTSADNSGAA